MKQFLCILVCLTLIFVVHAQPPLPTKPPLVRVADLKVGESQEIELHNRKKVTVKLVDLQETRDDIRGAVRVAKVKVEVDGQAITLTSGNYHLPQPVAGVRIDCPITRGYLENSNKEAWGLDKDARVRLWPAAGPYFRSGAFLYPAKQRWFASMTQMANEPVYVDGGENPKVRKIYYHYGLDIGGVEEMVDVVAATDGLVVSAAKTTLPGYEGTPVAPRYDVIYLLDEQGWYYRYSHLFTIDVKAGDRVKMGQKLGLLGKEGGSGGWSHLHFDITSKQPSGKWGIQEGYAFLWEAYLNQYAPALVAVARPHQLAWTGQKVTLDGSRSHADLSKIVKYEWTFADGKTASGPLVEHTYEKPGSYSEILKVTDGEGRVDYDFAVVQILDKARPDHLPPTIHAAYAPTFGIKPGDEVTFKVRTFRTTQGHELWDFGDGSPKVKVQSDGNVKPLARDGYAVTRHRFAKAGHYLVSVQRSTDDGRTAMARLQVRVGEME
jgi:murein DD-endopeptidase MepM/ murein hydrolase activator NlpD